MTKTDKSGRHYARLSDLREGDRVQVDGGFTCLTPSAVLDVGQSNDRLYVPCDCGYHFLDGQDDGDGYLVGVYLFSNMKETA